MKKKEIFSSFFELKPPSNKKYSGELRKKITECFENKTIKINSLSSFSIYLIFYFKDSPSRIDVDNLSKPVMDCLMGKIYKDDTQVFELYSKKEYRSLFSGISISVFRL